MGYGPVQVGNEGLFFIDLDSFMTNFSMVTINKATATWTQDWFLKLDDQTPAVNGVITHTLTVTNTHSEPQTIYPGAHLAEDVGYSGFSHSTMEYERKCERSTQNYAYPGTSRSGSRWRKGPKWLDPITLAPGTSQVYTVELDTDTNDTIDWSFVAWGELGSVSVTNNDASISKDSYPTLNTPRSEP